MKIQEVEPFEFDFLSFIKPMFFQPDRRNDSSMPQEYDFSHHLSPSVAAGSLSLDIPSPVPPIESEPDPQEPEYVNGEEEEDDHMQPVSNYAKLGLVSPGLRLQMGHLLTLDFLGL